MSMKSVLRNGSSSWATQLPVRSPVIKTIQTSVKKRDLLSNKKIISGEILVTASRESMGLKMDDWIAEKTF